MSIPNAVPAFTVNNKGTWILGMPFQVVEESHIFTPFEKQIIKGTIDVIKSVYYVEYPENFELQYLEIPVRVPARWYEQLSSLTIAVRRCRFHKDVYVAMEFHRDHIVVCPMDLRQYSTEWPDWKDEDWAKPRNITYIQYCSPTMFDDIFKLIKDHLEPNK